MYLARIEGHLTSTVRHASVHSCSLLLGRRLSSDGQPEGEPQVFVDKFGAARGAVVLVSTDGDLARQIFNDNTTPVRLTVVGIVDSVAGCGAWGSTAGGQEAT
jgi:ethanolamine utilization protein EutN